jgi:hypothetical protein
VSGPGLSEEETELELTQVQETREGSWERAWNVLRVKAEAEETVLREREWVC